MRAVLAASRIRWQKQNASGLVRPVRGGCNVQMKYIFFLSLPLYALDRATKYLVINNIDPNSPWPSGGASFFHLVNVTNTGAAFGSFKNNNTFFIAISCA